MLNLIFENHTITIPENWNECTAEQLEKVGAAFIADEPDALVTSVAILKALANRSGFWWARCSPEATAHFLEHIQWVFKPDELLTANPFFEIKANGRNVNRFYGPKNALMNCTFGEFHEAEMWYRKMLDDVPEAIEHLCAVLWREGKKFYNVVQDVDGDIRMPFNQNTVPWRANLFKRWPAGRKWAIARMYDGCRQQIIGRFPDVFDGGGGQSDTTAAFDGMFKLMRSLADTKRYGNMHDIEVLNLYTALYELTLNIQENEQQQAQMESHGVH